MKADKNIEFIARHYRYGAFDARRGWRRLGLVPHPAWRRWRVAAAVGALVVLSATAAVVYRHYHTQAPAVDATVQQQSPAAGVIRVIDFDNTPLAIVIERIEEVYGVEVSDIPANVDDYRLSLHYEGSAADLVETINDILDLHMSVSEL